MVGSTVSPTAWTQLDTTPALLGLDWVSFWMVLFGEAAERGRCRGPKLARTAAVRRTAHH